MSLGQAMHVRMLYDYEYTIPTQPVSISLKSGERFNVISKLTDNWWLATRLNQADDQVVIPAKYVEEIRLPSIPAKNLRSPTPSVSSVSSESTLPSTLPRGLNGPPKVPAKPGKKPESSRPELESSVMMELFDILTERISEGDDVVKNKTKIKTNKKQHSSNHKTTDDVRNDGSVTSPSRTGKKTGKKKQSHNMSLDDIPKVTRTLSDGTEESAGTGNINSLKYMTLDRLGGAFSDYWSVDRDILQKVGSPMSDKVGMDSMSSLDIDFNDDDNAFVSEKKHKARIPQLTFKPSLKKAVMAPVDAPVPEIGATSLKTFDNGYEMFHDELSGRNFYHNRVTGESSWVLPRKQAQQSKAGGLHLNGDTELPVDWTEERDEAGEVEFVHKHTKARVSSICIDSIKGKVSSSFKFKTKQDDLNRTYYYNTDTVTSYWYLPSEEEIINDIKVHIENNTFAEKEGYLSKAKIAEFGKKIKKSWSTSYVVLSRAMVYFYKDQKSYKTVKVPAVKPEAELDLRGAYVDINGSSRSSRKNVIQMKSAVGTEYLLHSEEEELIQDWYDALQNNLSVVGREALENPAMGAATLLRAAMYSPSHTSLGGSVGGGSGEINTSFQPLEGAGSDDHLNSDATPSPPADRKDGTLGGKNKKEEHKFHRAFRSSKRERSRTPDPASVLTDDKSRGGGKDKLKFWLSGRPTKDSLRAKGIYKDCEIFGSHLITICGREQNTVPRFVENCIAAVEKGGLRVDGIYRLSGNMAEIQKLRCAVNQGDSYNLMDPDLDIHVVTGSLKLFLRELLEPVVPFRFFQKFIDSYSSPDRSSRIPNIKELIALLPVENRDTLRELFRHLTRVMEHSKENRMSVQNLAIVFGPTLMWPEECDTPNLAVSMVQRGQLVEFLLTEFKHVF